MLVAKIYIWLIGVPFMNTIKGAEAIKRAILLFNFSFFCSSVSSTVGALLAGAALAVLRRLTAS